MKTRIFLGIMSLALGLSMTSCEDEENYSPSSSPVISQESVATGSTDVTATTATLHGTVNADLSSLAASSYDCGFLYGVSENALTETAKATLADGKLTADLSDLKTNATYYYKAFVRLQGKVTFSGKVSSFVTTNAKAVTAAAQSVDYASAMLGGSQTDAPSDATCGIVISTKSDVESVRAGLIVPAKALTASFSVEQAGLMPSTEYFYAAYINLGSGVVYGEVKSFSTLSKEMDVENDLVDLGLTVKWAKCNLGAKSATEVGGLFGYGDLGGVSNSIDVNDFASTNTYLSANDVVYQATKGYAMLPTADDFEELFALCATEWTEEGGVKGLKVTGTNGNTIFLPAAGSRTINNVSEAGTKGMYMTGTTNPSDNKFAVCYSFTETSKAKGTTPVYQCLSVRPVSTVRKVAMNKDFIYNTWEIDLSLSGVSKTFLGPIYFCGSDASWETWNNKKPTSGDAGVWEATYSGNEWMLNSIEDSRGQITFKKEEDGTNTVEVKYYNAEGIEVTENGTFTINEEDYTISITGARILLTSNYYSQVENQTTNLRILTLNEKSMQVGVVRNDGQLCAMNYILGKDKNGYKAELMCLGDFNHSDAWDKASVDLPGGDDLVGKTFKVTFETSEPRATGMVYVLDIPMLCTDYPNSFVRIESIKADGKDLTFDANKFFYGDIENGGTYRVELFNCWGNTKTNSPFRKETMGELGDEPALAFNSTLEVSFTVVSLTSNGSGSYGAKLIAVSNGWSSQEWGGETNQSVEVKYENYQYSISQPKVAFKYENTGFGEGTIMTFVEFANLYGVFPQTHAVLNTLKIDDTEVTGWDPAKVVDTSDGANYRLELWNCYGATKSSGCAFGTPDGDNIAELGFNASLDMDISFKSLFTVPSWE